MMKSGNWDKPLVIPKDNLNWIYNIFLIRIPSIVEFSLHFWFLFVLVQLYILFPLLYDFSKKSGVWGVISMIILHILYRLYSSNIPFSGWFSLIVWFNPFYYGIYLGINLVKYREKTEKIMDKLLPLGVIAWIVGTIASYYHLGETICNPLASAGLIIIIYKIASLNWNISWLNNISYEIYLIHMPFIGFYRHFFGFVTKPILGIYVFFIITTVAMAYALYFISNLINSLIYRIKHYSTSSITQ